MIEGGCGDVMVAGGVESMSRAPLVIAKGQTAFDRTCDMYDTTIGWRFINQKLSDLHTPYTMGETAENVAKQWSISREEQDAFAHGSQQKWKAASDSGIWSDEIVPVHIPQRKGDPIVIDMDEHPRPEVTLEKLSTLNPAFSTDEGATVTAGNSSGVNDGAAAVVLVEESIAKEKGLHILGYVGPSAACGVDPSIMGTGPVQATNKLLKATGLSIKEIDRVELNEAFAAQSIACIKELKLDETIVNVNGGSIAI
jgi:acetyl-CoA acetyltransferase family protein